MSEQLVLTLAAASVGLIAALFFAIGNILNTAHKIVDQASPRWNFSEPVAFALAAQRAQYVVGALLLVASFLLQVAAALALPATPANLPPLFHTWTAIVFAVLLLAGLIGYALSEWLRRSTIRKVKRLAPPKK